MTLRHFIHVDPASGGCQGCLAGSSVKHVAGGRYYGRNSEAARKEAGETGDETSGEIHPRESS